VVIDCQTDRVEKVIRDQSLELLPVHVRLVYLWLNPPSDEVQLPARTWTEGD
jgi:hypothetical protein